MSPRLTSVSFFHGHPRPQTRTKPWGPELPGPRCSLRGTSLSPGTHWAPDHLCESERRPRGDPEGRPGGGPCIFPKRFGARHQEAAAIRLPHGEVPGGIRREDGRGSAARPVGARTGDTPAGRAARPQHQPGRPAHGVGPLPRGPRRRLLTRTRPAFMSKPVVPRSPPAPRLRSGSPRHVYASRPGFSFLLLPFGRPDHRTLFSQCEKLIDRDFCELVLSALKRVTTGFDFWFLLIF